MRGLNIKQQSGVVLFISLVMLLILTVLGLSSVQSTSMQLLMSRNARDAELAFQSAETAIILAEQYIETLNNTAPFQAANTAGRYDAVTNGVVDLATFDWNTSASNARGFATIPSIITGVYSQPKYFIEFWRTVVSDEDRLNMDNIGQETGSGKTQVFRVTTQGTGGTESAKVIIRTTYGKKF